MIALCLGHGEKIEEWISFFRVLVRFECDEWLRHILILPVSSVELVDRGQGGLLSSLLFFHPW